MNMRKICMPPMWIALIVTCIGIYGTNLLYMGITKGGMSSGIIGGILLVPSVVFVGTPLAFAYHAKRQQRLQRAK